MVGKKCMFKIINKKTINMEWWMGLLLVTGVLISHVSFSDTTNIIVLENLIFWIGF